MTEIVLNAQASPEQLLGAAVRIARNSLSITGAEVCSRAGISRAMLSEIERGKRSPSMGALRRLALACFVPLSQVVRVAECLTAGEVLPFTAEEFHPAIRHAIRKARPPVADSDFDPARPKRAVSIP